MIIRGMEIYTNETNILSNFEIMFVSEIFYPAPNFSLHKAYEFPGITTTSLTILSYSGGSINEVLVHGQVASSSQANSSFAP